MIVNLSPGATPPIIRLSSGFVTSLVFLDSKGAPWRIQACDLGDPNSFNHPME
ncbi:DotH/IcmK family type IV secretion protein [Candidatus Coxiella mudrowiae]|uniref:DotH/IcmK family type IV secretion protein n=1 Tax=Candidatus Coxiella mudrowiae TaxID=2054173 RepID=UPI000AD7E088|nr:DotH/IcmK family type IV secretion protein [Candidatus Coxiella mudrowiae]